MECCSPSRVWKFAFVPFLILCAYAPRPLLGAGTFEEVQTGKGSPVDAASTTVSTATNLTAVNDHLYLAFIGVKPDIDVIGVSGIGLTWQFLAEQGSDNAARIEVWWAQGTPTGDGPVTATLAAGNLKNVVIAVARYSGVDSASPIGVVVTNFAADTASPTVSLTTTIDNAVVVAPFTHRLRTFTADAGNTVRVDNLKEGTSGAVASLTFLEKTGPVSPPGSVTLSGSLNAATDWAGVAVELIPPSAPSPPGPITVLP